MKRILQALLVLLLVSLMLFVMLRIVPGNPVAVLMGEHANQATIDRLTAELGLDQPIHVQFFRYLSGAVRGDFGTSYSLGKPVSGLMGTAFVNTLLLSLAAALFAWITGGLCGLLAAIRKNSIPDRLFMGFSLLGTKFPKAM